eukprot:TRINITY_DN15081_c0_g1_i1.p1 TRINITY_DN15081_c0_g1~~TRINITY_DN15081_c0_g1_i1.p1  ORF type:complete len:323 (-),score=62.01 TRINITY_DN15081_c0_g1_i1:185-1120(-)
MTASAPHWSYEQWLSELTTLLRLHPDSPSNISGVRKASLYIETMLRTLGFKVQRIVNNDNAGADILFAIRPPTHNTCTSYVGLFGHFDVETIGDTSEWGVSDPWTPTEVDGRLFARGVGDNLGPLLLRLITLQHVITDDRVALPGLVWLLHGEEEIQSPFAHLTYPFLERYLPEDTKASVLSSVVLWLEETGYFLGETSGVGGGAQQRLLFNHVDSNPLLSDALLKVISLLAEEEGRPRPQVQHRYLNKAFGVEGCPCLKHLVEPQPLLYLAIGPNDVRTNIHKPNESIPIATLATSSRQFVDVLSTVQSL